MSYLLPWLLILPIAGAMIGVFLPTPRASKTWALTVSLLTAALAVCLAWGFFHTPSSSSLRIVFGPEAGEASPLRLTAIGAAFSLGIDAISLWLVLLTVLLVPASLAASFAAIQHRQKEYYNWMLLLMAAMIGVFISRDLLLFYVFFELTLIPMFFIIGIWGGSDRDYAAAKFFLFTFTGSVFTLAVVIFLGLHADPITRGPSFDLNDVVRYAQSLDPSIRWWLLLGLLAGFAVKVPLFPLHTWLPLAHTEAPTAGSVILAGVLLKLGTYGLLRLAVPIGLVSTAAGGVAFPSLLRFIGLLCVIGIIYGALVAWVQKDIKKLVAYSSVSHLGFCVLGLVAFNTNGIGVQGSVLYMINHGLSTGAMFLVIGMIYERFHTRDINQLSGVARRMPVLGFFFVFFVLSSIGLPGLNGFVSEFLTILAAFTSPHLGTGFGTFAALGVILGAVYMLHLTARVIFGPLKTPDASQLHGAGAIHATPLGADIGKREIGLLIPIALAVLVLGVMPTPLLKSILQPSQEVLQTLAPARPSHLHSAQITKQFSPLSPLPVHRERDRVRVVSNAANSPIDPLVGTLTPTLSQSIGRGGNGATSSSYSAKFAP